MRFLVDEDLSRALVDRLHELGHVAERVSDVGRSGQPDHVVWQMAFERDAIYITANPEDFIGLAAGSELHAGLVVFRAGELRRDEQVQWLEGVLRWLDANPRDLVNQIVEVYGPTDEDIDCYPLPS